MSVAAIPNLIIENFCAKGDRSKYTQITRAEVSVSSTTACVKISRLDKVSEFEQEVFDKFLETVQGTFCENITNQTYIFGKGSCTDVTVLTFSVDQGLDQDLLDKTKSVVKELFPNVSEPKK